MFAFRNINRFFRGAFLLNIFRANQNCFLLTTHACRAAVFAASAMFVYRNEMKIDF